MRNNYRLLVLVTAVVLAAVVVEPLAAVPAPAEGAERIEAAAAAEKSIANMSEAELRSVIERFVENFYLAGEDLSEDQLKTIYAPVVNYFGSRRKSRSAIVRDQLRYYRRWPDRKFELIPQTLSVVRSDAADQVIDVVFDYLFDTRSGKRRARGRGVAMLTLDFSVAGGQIVRERGKVLERFR
ncbi:MAG: hypothetical protein APF80_15100 [Alphaproteobacteria bacterium BRH_c36]|nr:MAG: hypothetical protein APF80_15100 [Alphaproteobacteria bacterium BRH_c36]